MPWSHWAAIHLAANWEKTTGVALADFTSDLYVPDSLFAILATAAQHPAWVRRIDGENTPGVWVPGCRIMVEDDREAGEHAICLGYNQGNHELMLCLDWPDGRDRRYAIPVLVS